MTPRFVTLIGAQMTPYLPTLAQLCTVVFREWPHLYDGDGRYDEAHLTTLRRSARSVLILAYDGETIIGASTALPLEDATPNIQDPFLRRNLPLGDYFYFPESVLLSAFRGRGIGATWFNMREAHARTISNCAFSCFCAIRRSENDGRQPPDVVSPRALWRRQGYVPSPDLVCTIAWRELGQAHEIDHTLQFWTKRLRPSGSAVQPIATSGGSA